MFLLVFDVKQVFIFSIYIGKIYWHCLILDRWGSNRGHYPNEICQTYV